MKQPSKCWVVYLLRCADGTLYCGVTNDLLKRIAAHNCGAGARYTRSRRPVEVVWVRRCRSKVNAFKAEYATKLLTRAEKDGLVAQASVVSRRTTDKPQRHKMPCASLTHFSTRSCRA